MDVKPDEFPIEYDIQKDNAVATKLPSHLKIHTDAPGSSANEPEDYALNSLLQAFTDATGWRPVHLSGTPHRRNRSDGQERAPRLPLRERMQLISTAPMDGMLDWDGSEGLSLTSEDSAWKLMEQIDLLIVELDASRSAVERQEAELATALGVSVRGDESEILASRLSESLHRAAELTGSDAAALYLLNDNTSELKMRSCWGMPVSALSKPPRKLRGSMADLEALLGNAVLLENTALASDWNCPEDYAAAMCIPIGSPTMPHGTLWLWSNHVRDFSTSDIDAGKAAGDKILVDIERSVLADEVLRQRGLDREIEDASLVQASRLPSQQALHADYELSAWTFQGRALGGNFHSWTVNRHGNICAALGSAARQGTAGALVANSLQTIVETCWNASHRPGQILRKANDMLWDTKDRNWKSSLFYAQIHPESGSMQLGLAGSIQAFIIGERGFRMLPGTPTMLATAPDTQFSTQQLYLEGGELLLVASEAVVGGLKRGGFDQHALLQLIRESYDEPVEDIVDQLQALLPIVSAGEKLNDDRSLMLLRRRF